MFRISAHSRPLRLIVPAKPHRKSLDSPVLLKESQSLSRFTKCVNMLPLLILILINPAAMPVSAQGLHGNHPAYLHALTDLRTARWLLSHQPGDRKVYVGEHVANDEIDAAIKEIKRASIDDGKDINDHPSVDVKEHGSRLLRAIETLEKAHADIDQAEDNPEVRDLRHRALWHIDRAKRAADQAHAEWLKDSRD